MKTIKLKFCDGMAESDLVFLPILQKHYHVVFSDEPDYLIYGPFGNEHLRYDCIKIFTTGECIVPDFNECDYATGFDELSFGDRYLQLPLCSIMSRGGINPMEMALERGKSLPSVENKGFCSFVVSNANGMAERTEFFELLSRYKRVDSGGAYLNNVGGRVENKLLFEHAHKFSIAFENERYPGYTTEKIVDAFAAGGIPIYYGDPNIGKYFNTKAFINCGDFPDLAAAAEFVRKVDQDDALYAKMLSEPILRDGIPGMAGLEPFLLRIFDAELSEARRRPRSPMAYAFERANGAYESKWLRAYLKPYRAAKKLKEKLKSI